VTKVEFYVNGFLLGALTASPYSANWINVAAGTYTISAKVFDSVGGVATTNSAIAKVHAADPNNTAPAISLNFPMANATYTAPALVPLSSAVSDNGSINRVEFYVNNALLGTLTAPPYNATWSNAPAGTYTLAAKAYDNLGVATVSATKTITVYATSTGNVAPAVTLASPINNATYSAPGTVVFSTAATDSDGTINRVEYYVNGALLAGSSTPPYYGNWQNVAAGTYQITARAYDNLGAVTTSAPNTIVVNSVSPANVVPSANLNLPVNNSTYAAPSDIPLSVTASDSDGSINRTEFYANGVLLGIKTSPPYDAIFANVGAGSYALTAKAFDNLGAVTTTTANTVVVNTPNTNNSPPAVSVTSPLNGAIYTTPATFLLSVAASDTDGTINRVEFYMGSALIGVGTVPPYEGTISNLGLGTYALTAKAYDNLGAVTASSAVNITVAAANVAPTVSITAPATGATYIAPAAITISATAADTDGSIAKVEFYNGATLVGTDTTSPYSLSLSNVAAGSYAYTAKAYDNTGAITTSAVVNVTVNNNVAPTVSLTAPANDANYQLPATVSLTATAADSDGTITKVEFYDGATLLATDTTSPYSHAWASPGVGSHSLTAKAYDNLGAVTASSAVNITVAAANVAPTVSITAPATGATYIAPAAITISATAADTDGSIAKVEFYNGATLVGTDTTSPYSLSLSNVAAGSYAYTAKAYDNTGAITTSAVVNVTVNNNVAPTVSLTVPANDASYDAPANIALSATASDIDGTIEKVEFYRGATLLGTITSEPYVYLWSNVDVGAYDVSAKAYDNLGAVAASGIVTVVVSVPPNEPPAVSLTSPTPAESFTALASITLSANAADSDGAVTKVDFYQGTTLVGTATQAPFTYEWTNVANGNYSITAKAYDNSDAVTTSDAVAISVNAPPGVSLTAPANNTVFAAPATVTLNATATDADGSISKVEFYNGEALLGTDVAPPYSLALNNVEAGIYAYTAKSYDNLGASAISTVVNVTVNTLPTVALTAPANNATYIAPASITLDVTAADPDGSISKVEFYNGATLVGTDTTNSYSLNLSDVATGSYSYTAKAYDDLGGISSSTVVNVTVNAANVLPTVSLTAPANNASYTAPASISLAATATDTDGSISKVEFYNGANLLETDTSDPYTFTWNAVPAGSHTLIAKAYDNTGAAVDSASVVVTVNALPSVNLTSPAANSVFMAPATIDMSATATDEDGPISKVEFYNGANLLESVTQLPYAYTWTSVPAGTYNLQAKAYDSTGAVTASSSVSVTVNSLPTAAITGPANNSVYQAPAAITVEATASDSDGTISKVEFYNGSSLVGTDNTPPYSLALNSVAAGPYTYTVKAYDNLGGTHISAAVSVTVNAQPSVSITAPANNAAFNSPATINLSATAVDADGSISKVEFYNGASLIGTANAEPYNYAWTGAAPGSYSVTAKAYDNGGGVTTSAAITVSVNGAPTVNITAPANNATLAPPASVVITATAADVDGTISKVEFYSGATLLGTDTSAPYSYTWNDVVSGSYALTAMAYDDAGNTSVSAPVSIVVNKSPSVALTSPTDASTYAAPASIPLSATASDEDGSISKVEFYNGANLIGTLTSGPYNAIWPNVSAGTYILTAKAYDNAGAVATSTATTVTVTGTGNTKPVVSIALPINNAAYQQDAAVPIVVDAYDPDTAGLLSTVQLYFNGQLYGGWNDINARIARRTLSRSDLPAGTYDVQAVAWDNAGEFTISATATIMISAANPQNAPPAVAIQLPINNATYMQASANAGVTLPIITAAADPDGTINRVEYYLTAGTTQYYLGASTASPYPFGVTVGAGTYVLEAYAYDNLGVRTISAPRTVVVNPPTPADVPPTATLDSPLNNAVYHAPALIPIAASASDSDGTINRVELGINGALFATWDALPYTLNLNVPSPGTYTFQVRAFDNLGALAYSSISTVTVNALPTVSIATPASGTGYEVPANIVLTATAADSDGAIAMVEYYNGTALLGSATSAPYSFTWNGVGLGEYSITAKAYDDRGGVQMSSPVSVGVYPPNTLPSVTLTSPAPATLSAPVSITISASASDADGSIAKVEFYNGPTLLYTDTTSPYGFTWSNVGAGVYTLTAKAYDNSGTTNVSAAVPITVNTPPTVNLTSPVNNQKFNAPAIIDLAANAADVGGSISKVEFYNGAAFLGEDTSAPYTHTWLGVPAGVHALTAKAYDNLGTTTVSSSVSVTVNAPPSVTLDTPANNSVHAAPASIALSATAADVDGTIAKVEFYNGSTRLNTDTTAPYAYTWNSVGSGQYNLTAKAYDNSGAVVASSVAVVKVNALPTGSITAPSVAAKFTAPASVPVSVTAADADGTIAKVEFYEGANLLGIDTEAPYEFTWNGVASGSYSLTAKIHDNDGEIKTTAAVAISATLPPVVALTGPANMSTFTTSTSIPLTATASDPDGTISKVEFYDGTDLIGTDTTSPYSYVWGTAPAGIRSIAAKAYDNAGGTAVSSPIVITISPQPSPIVYTYDELGRLIGVQH